MTKTTFTTAAVTGALAAIVVLAGVPSAFAASGETVTFKVSTAGLDLRTSQGAESMLRRIETASSAICGGAPYIGDLDATQDWKACVSHNVSQAVSELGAPIVTDSGQQPGARQTASNSR